jgi:hypothetical protein
MDKAFFAFADLADKSRHREYNAWHQLEHRPENLALPGVAFGDRWVHTPDCAAEAVSAEGLAGVDYVTMYWFRDPVLASFEDFLRLADRTFQLGRGPAFSYVRRPFLGEFTPIKGYAAARIRIDAEALIYRPNTGIELVLTQIGESSSEQAQGLFAWYDSEYIPQLLQSPQVAGAWTFAGTVSHSVAGGTADTGVVGSSDSDQLRMLIVYLDGDPGEYRSAKAERSFASRSAGPSSCETTLFDSVLRSIEPWRWDWFDQGSRT